MRTIAIILFRKSKTEIVFFTHLNPSNFQNLNEMHIPKCFPSPRQSLLDEPNPNSPANSQAAQLYQENKREYEKRVSAIVEQSCRDC